MGLCSQRLHSWENVDIAKSSTQGSIPYLSIDIEYLNTLVSSAVPAASFKSVCEERSNSLAQADLELVANFLLQPPKYWDSSPGFHCLFIDVLVPSNSPMQEDGWLQCCFLFYVVDFHISFPKWPFIEWCFFHFPIIAMAAKTPLSERIPHLS